MRWLLCLFAVVALESMALSQCWGQVSRGTVVSPRYVPVAAVEVLQWKEFAPGSDQVDLWQGNKQLGAWSRAANEYRPLLNYQLGQWGHAGPPPIPVPAEYVQVQVGDDSKAVPNFGIDLEHWRESKKPAYVRGGSQISKETAYELVQNGVPDDRGKLPVTCIGSDADRARFLTDWKANAAELDKKCKVWSAGPDHWSLKDNVTGQPMFKTDGTPTIYVQAPDGQVLHRQDDWRGPGDFTAIRKAVQNYESRKDPDLRKPAVPGLPSEPLQIPAPWLVLGAAALVFLVRK